jgi:hypothetical protein
MKVELEMTIDEEDGAVALQKLSELANRAKEMGFTVIEAEVEADEDDHEEEEDKDE